PKGADGDSHDRRCSRHLAYSLARAGSRGRQGPAVHAAALCHSSPVPRRLGWGKPPVQDPRTRCGQPPPQTRRLAVTCRLLTLGVLLAGLTFSNALAGAEPQHSSESRTATPSTNRSHPLYQRRGTWYEFLLKQFN